MLFSFTLFALSWIFFFIFADKKKIVVFSHTCLLGMYFATTTDMMTIVYPLWYYPASNKTHMFFRHVIQDISVYPVVIYFFLQTLPKIQTAFTIARHIFYWSILAYIIEWIAIRTGSMEYHLWWNMRCSYVADWILFLIFYFHHKWRVKHAGERLLLP